MSQVAVQAQPDTQVMPTVEYPGIVVKVADAPAREAVKAPVQTALSTKERDGIVKQLNKTLEAFDTRVSLSLDDKLHQTVIKVIDNESGKVVRQIPSEQLLRISERITELLGVIYDEKM
jgi:flagellar protein FlaG